MRNKNLIGTGVALITPFNEDFSIDFQSLDDLIEHLLSQGIDYFVVMGTTGESVTLSEDEQNKVLEFVVKKINGKKPIVLGLGGNNTFQIINRIKQINFNDIEAILSVCPYYNKPSQNGIFNHYSSIALNCPVDVILYNVPGRTALNMHPQTVKSLAEKHHNIIGIKEASGDISQCMDIISLCPNDFLVISGDDKMTFPIMLLGGVGVISVQAMALPNIFSKMVNSLLNDDINQAREYHFDLLKSVDLFYIDGNPSGVKEALFYQGLCQSNQVRLPLIKMTKTHAKLLRSMLDSY